MIENLDKTKRRKFAEMLAWLASSDNRDDETRSLAKDILDTLCMIGQSHKKAMHLQNDIPFDRIWSHRPTRNIPNGRDR